MTTILRNSFFIKSSVAMSALVIVVLIAVYHLYQTFTVSVARNMEIVRLSDKAAYLDEVLTMSARMAVLTGDTEWKKRYDISDPELTHILTTLFGLESHSSNQPLISEISLINERLSLIDRQAFGAMQAGHPEQAKLLLFNNTYVSDKNRYNETLAHFVKSLKEDSEKKSANLDMTMICIMVVVILLLWICCAWLLAVNMERSSALRQKAETLSRLKSEFLASMSHEIRTPMNGILGMAELILGTQPNPQVEGYARIIINSGESLMTIIDDILDFSKIEAGKMVLDPMPVDMLELADEITRLYSVKARDKALELAVRYVPGTEQFVYADPVRLRQILGNLISNAIKFTEKGHVTLTISEEKSEGKVADEIKLRFMLEDTGIGLSKEACGKIFEKFMQADSSTTRRFGGTGLGLSISQSLIAMMNGEIGVESTEGQGSVFWFTVTCRRNSKEYRSLSKPPVLRDIKVLVVDDFAVIRQLVTEQLTQMGMRCQSAENAKTALAMMHQASAEMDPFQLVLIDYLMPEIQGDMLASMINDYPDLRSACLVMLTSAGSPLADEEFVKKGFSAYIPKPVETRGMARSLAMIWSRYQQGETQQLIRVDTGFSGNISTEAEKELTATGACVLVAEDNLINQVFIREILEEMGCVCTIVANGKDAVQEVQNKPYDLILMDCLMPVMDGFDATRIICRLKSEGQVRATLPIIALTANAMKGDRERCLSAGMDEYISKPVRKKELKNVVSSWVKNRGVEITASAIPVNQPGQTQRDMPLAGSSIPVMEGEEEVEVQGAVLDMETVRQAREILKGKYDAMVTMFITGSETRLEEIRTGLEAGDRDGVIRAAHSLKSTAMQMGAERLSNHAKQMEAMGRRCAENKPEPEDGEEKMTRLYQEAIVILADTVSAFQFRAA